MPVKKEIFDPPIGYRRTKYDFTIEKINVDKSGKSAGKRFYCERCMWAKIYKGYTKRYDLEIHLAKCGKTNEEREKEKKEKKEKKSHKYVCRLCKATFTERENAKKHKCPKKDKKKTDVIEIDD